MSFVGSKSLDYFVKKIEFYTCGQLYQKWRNQKHRYKNAPFNGIKVEIEYVDSLDMINVNQESIGQPLYSLNENINNLNITDLVEMNDFKNNFNSKSETTKPNNFLKPLTVLCLHGAPGSHKDYQHVIRKLIQRNVRVIVPNFPNYNLTKESFYFNHSPSEKAEFIKDFLRNIDVKNIDVLVCHSSSIFVGSKLIEESLNLNAEKNIIENSIENSIENIQSNKNNILKVQNSIKFKTKKILKSKNTIEKSEMETNKEINPNFKPEFYFGSLIMVNSCTHKQLKQLQPFLRNSVFEPTVFFYKLKLSRVLIRYCGKIVLDIFGSPVDYNNFDNVMLTLTTLLRSNRFNLKRRLIKIVEKIPTIMIFTEKDSLISKKHYYALANLLNMKSIQCDFSSATNRLNDTNETNTVDKKDKSFSIDGNSSLAQKSSNILDVNNNKNLDLNKTLSTNTLVFDLKNYPYAVSIKNAGHYSQITHSHVLDKHIANLIININLTKV